jgi:serine/threonine protein kinase
VTPERWSQIRDLFERCVELAPPARDALLAEECAADAELEQEVRRLVSADDAAGEFLQQTPLARLEPSIGVGSRVGAYRIEKEVGEGGMARVFLACRVDDPFRRPVAIKLIRPAVESAELTRRFYQERRILLQLHHPNIVALLDTGTTEQGSPFVVMDYVDGKPVDRYCDDLPLATRARIELFRVVCHAVQYAHDQQVIHRDLKPSNILVAADGTVKLLDFGIAKLLTHQTGSTIDLTRTGRGLMTPAYASPEQLTGAVATAASDVYALGMVLHKLLVGALPYDVEQLSIEGIAEVVCRAPIERPSRAASRLAALGLGSRAIARELAGDLDAILLAALEKAPAARYPTVAALTADLGRMLDDRPISLRWSSPWYRSGKWARRGVCRVRGALLHGWRLLRPALASDDALRHVQELTRSATDLSRRGEIHEAVRLLRDALRYAEDLSRDPASSERALRAVSFAGNRLALLLQASGDRHAALDLFVRTIEANRTLLAAVPADARAAANIRGNSANVGALYESFAADAGVVWAERIRCWQEARAWYKRAGEITVPDDVAAGGDLALVRRVLDRVGACDEALARLANLPPSRESVR